MENIVSIKPFLAVLVSFISAIFILSARKNPNLRESWSIIAGVLKLFIVLSMIPAVVYNNTIISIHCLLSYQVLRLVSGLMRLDSCLP